MVNNFLTFLRSEVLRQNYTSFNSGICERNEPTLVGLFIIILINILPLNSILPFFKDMELSSILALGLW